MEDTKKDITLDLESPYPFTGYQSQDEWMRYRRPIDDNRERIGWGGDCE